MSRDDSSLPRTSDVVSGDDDGGSAPAIGRERRITAVVLLLIALFTLGDLIEDRFDGAPWSHVLEEAAIVLVAASVAVVLFRKSRAPLIEKNNLLQRQLVTARADAQRWQEEAGQFLTGLSSAISTQLDAWQLTDAEKDIALLLLKGFSHKEISALRETSERTVRQQAASLYSKSGLTGRAELSAFFLEDLLSAPAALDGKSSSTRS